MWCIVNLPNGTQQAVKWDPKAIGQECLEKVCTALGIICETEYFGLVPWSPNQKESRTRQWINLRNRLSCDSSSSIQLMLALRVKFWVPVHFILQESVRNLFFMQAKVDLLEGRLNASDWTNASKLAALLCQADGIRFNEAALKAKCPIRMRKEHELLLKLQQQTQPHSTLHKERKEKEYVLSFKKRKLSKQKSVEHIEHQALAQAQALAAQQQQATTSTSASTTSAAYTAAATLAAHSYSLSAPTVSAAGMSTTSPASSTNSASAATLSAPSDATAGTSSSSASTSPSNTSTNSTLEDRLATSPLRVYQDYLVWPAGDYGNQLPDDFLRQIAVEHGKLAELKMTPKSAKYWLLQAIQELSGYGEELFSGVSTNENATRCDIAVGAHGITVCRGGDEKHNIPFSAIAAAKSFRRTFKLEYVDDHNDRKDLEIKLSKHAIAAGLYRSITERHAFYVCDKVRGVVTNQFTRDLKGTIASMFKEDTELGKRYVFDIRHTCREVHDQARRTLHERGIEITMQAGGSAGAALAGVDDIANYLPTSSSLLGAAAVASDGAEACSSGAVGSNNSSSSAVGLGAACSLAGKLDLAIREKEAREAAIERCVDTRISEAMTCKICMDRAINTMFNPCCHVIACAECAARCSNCPNCRVKITSVVKIYLPPELRTSQSGSTDASPQNSSSGRGSSVGGANGDTANIDASPAATANSIPAGTAPKVSTAA